MNAETKKAEAILARLEREYESEGLRPIRWKPPQQEGCRACGNTYKGPWIVNILASRVLERGEALLFVAVLCGSCQGNEDQRDQVAENVVSDYLKRAKARESKQG